MSRGLPVMKINFYCPRWGCEGIPVTTFCNMVKDAGFEGVEMSLPLDGPEKSEILNAIEGAGLKLIAQHWETSTVDFDAHKTEYRQRLENLATAKPVFINTQTGKDFFSFEQNAELIQIAAEVAAKHDVKIIHETHRGKFSFAAHVVHDFLQRLPDLRLTLDMSHWCCTAESWLDDQPEAMSLAVSRTDHIHSRVGFPEGPQIPDPRVPEWKEALNIHTDFWQQVVDARKKDGWDTFTITTEFGPAPYMTLLPFSRQPITNQWEVNVFMKDHLKSVLKA